MNKPPEVIPVVEQQPATIATTIASVDLKLRDSLAEITKANDYDPASTISVLERMGLSTATQFVKPMLAILKRSPHSPLRQLTTFQVQALYVANERMQGIILDELEADLSSGRRNPSEVRTGITRTLQLQYRAKIDAAKQREGRIASKTRDDYAREVVELREQVETYEAVLEQVAKEVGMDVNEFVANLLSQNL